MFGQIPTFAVFKGNVKIALGLLDVDEIYNPFILALSQQIDLPLEVNLFFL